MRKILRVARREYKATVRTKGFIVGLVLAPILMGGSAIAFALLKDRVDTTDKRVAVVDRSHLVAEALVQAAEERNQRVVHDEETGKKLRPAYLLELVEPDAEGVEAQRLALSDRVRRGELHAFAEIGEGILHPGRSPQTARIAYHARNPALDEVREWIDNPINAELRRLRLAEAGVDASEIEDLFHWTFAEGLGLVSADPETGGVTSAERRGEAEAILVPLILPLLLFIMLLMGAVPLLGAVTEEKSQRIAEVMLGSIKPFEFMMGKLLGGVCVSLTAATVYVVLGVLLIRHMELGAFVPYHALPWFFAWVITAIFMYGAVFAALGSACNDASEVQAVTLPAMMPVIVPMFVQMPVVMHPESAFATSLSLFPLFTPMLMLIRQCTPGGVPLWQPSVGLLGVLVFTLLFVWAGSRVFRVGILMQGTPPRLGNILRWVMREE